MFHEIIRNLQLEKNTRCSDSRRQLVDVTNTPDSARRTKRKHKRSRATNRKRSRIDPEPVEPTRSGRDDDSHNSSSSESEDEDDTGNVDDDDDNAKTTRAGRLYVLNYGLWVKGNAHIFQTKFDPSYDEKERFETTAMKVQGQLRDINHTLPYDLQATKSSKTLKWISNKVCSSPSNFMS